MGELWLRSLRLVFAAAFAAVGYVASSALDGNPAGAASCSFVGRQYGAQFSNVAAYGMDGYIQYPTNGLSDPNCDHVVWYFNLTATNSTIVRWDQIGVNVGIEPDGVHTSQSVFAESNDYCGYHYSSFGTPPYVNTAYYLTYTGVYSNLYCSSTWYQFAARDGAWTNPPYTYLTLDVASPQWSAAQEVLRQGSLWENPGPSYFGFPSYDLGHGMAWYNQPANTWGTWASNQGSIFSSANYTACSDVALRAFHVHYGGGCP
jgi:hypothetical protein